MDNSNIPLRKCTKCGEEKPATAEYFARTKKTKLGLIAQCKTCANKQREQYYINHPEALKKKQHRNREMAKEKYRSDPEYRAKNIEAAKARNKKYWCDAEKRTQIKARQRLRNHTEEYKARRRVVMAKRKRDPAFRQQLRKRHNQYYQNHRDEILKRVADYNRENPHVPKTARIRRKTRKRSLPSTFTSKHWLLCLDYWHYCCAVCDSQLRDLFGDIEPHADHWIALNSPNCPGTTPDNMICLCNKCNRAKSDKYPEQWLIDDFGKHSAAKILKRINQYFGWIEQQ